MNRIDRCFEELRGSGRKGFVAYVTAGDPTMDATIEIVAALERAGADVVELGVPFSDPLADGVVNQAAAQRALEAGATVPRVFEMLRRLRSRSDVPIVLFTYLNPVYQYGYERFHTDAAAAGADGILILDLPHEEQTANAELAGGNALCSIRLVAPTTPSGRIAGITSDATGFIYYVSREGVTGEQQELSASIGARVAAIRETTPLPIAVGFGISTPEQAKAVAASADAVVVGSAIVRRIAEHGSKPGLDRMVEVFVRPLTEAVHGS